jgi:hypothetical protein
MRKYIVVIFLGIFALSVSSSPICNINQELNKDTAAKLSEFRDQTYSTCLTCADSSCQLKTWPEEKKVMRQCVNYFFAHLVMFPNFLKSPITLNQAKLKLNFPTSLIPRGK